MPSGTNPGEAIRSSLRLARRVEELGYRRVWYAEHHNFPTIASTTPEILIAMAAEVTNRIHVGSGGVMLPNHASLKVAETFKMLEALHPGRIDLGIGRAPGTDPATTVALRGSMEALGAEDFPRQLGELIAYGLGPVASPLSPKVFVSAVPTEVPLPSVWLLGSSDYSSRLSAQLGLGFAFAGHFSELPPEGPMLSYRDQFQPGALDAPYSILTLSVVCADSDEEAERLALSQILAFTLVRTGQKAVLVSPEEVMARPFNAMEEGVARLVRARMVVGSPSTVQAEIARLADITQASEVMIATTVFDPDARERSYELVAS